MIGSACAPRARTHARSLHDRRARYAICMHAACVRAQEDVGVRNRLHITKIIDHLAALPLERPKVTLSVEGNIGTGKVRPWRLGMHGRGARAGG